MTSSNSERTRLSGDEERASLDKLSANWERLGYSYRRRTDREPHILLCQSSFTESVTAESFAATLEKNGIDKLIVYQEWHPDGSSPVWEQSVKVFYPAYNGAECIATDRDGTLLFYASHEGSLAVSGTRAIELLAEMWPDFAQYPFRWHYPENNSLSLSVCKVNEAGRSLRFTHERPILDFDFSPDNRSIAIADLDSYLYIRDTESGESKISIKGATPFKSIRFSHDGAFLVTLDSFDNVRYYDAQSGGEIATEHQPTPICDGIAAYSDDRTMIAFYDRDSVQLRNLATLSDICIPVRNVTFAAFSADCSKIAIGNGEMVVAVYDTKTGIKLNEMVVGSYPRALLFAGDGKNLCITLGPQNASIHNVETGKQVSNLSLAGLRYGIRAGSHGNLIYFCSDAHVVNILDADSGEPVSKVKVGTWVHRIKFDCSEKYVVLGGLGRVWVADVQTGRNTFVGEHKGVRKVFRADASTGQQIAFDEPYDTRVDAVALSEDGLMVASAAGNSVRVWNTRTGELRVEVKFVEGTYGGFGDIALSPDGELVAVGDLAGGVYVYSVNPLRTLTTIVHEGGIKSLCFSSDGRFLVSGGNDKKTRVSDAHTGKLIASMRHNSSVISVAISNDGQTVSSVCHSTGTVTWSVKTQRQLGFVANTDRFETDVQLTDTALVIAGYADEMYFQSRHSFNGDLIQDKRFTRRHNQHGARIVASSSGRFVAAGGYENKIEAFSFEDGNRDAVLDCNMEVSGICSDRSNGRFVVICSTDGRLTLWDSVDKKEVVSLETGCSPSRIGLSDDGKRCAILAR